MAIRTCLLLTPKSTGYPIPETEQEYLQANAVFRHLHNGTFQDVSGEAGPDMRARAAHRGAAFGDLNNDGLVDVVVSVIGGSPELLYNTSQAHNHGSRFKPSAQRAIATELAPE